MERPLTKNFRKSGGEPPGIKDYEKNGGYESVRKALKSMAPDEVVKVVKESNLMGRGGAGFSTGMKWGFVPKNVPGPKFLLANGDEMEPGTFKDRFLMENDPHQLVEGMIVSGYAIQSSVGYIFLRGDYLFSEKLLEKAIHDANAAGYLGKNILGSGFDFELHLHMSAGRYICGEETALINSLEGRRANPRSKPPFPIASGLWGRPSVVNNIETLCNVPHIVNNGAEWFKKLSVTGEGGTKIYGVSGRVKHPGAWELPLGTTIREILEEHAGGMQEGYRLRGIIPGGVSTEFLVEEHLDLNMDFKTVQKAGSRLGTGTMIMLDDKTCPVGFVRNIEKFFARESCGWCTPCRQGLPWVYQMISALEDGEGTAEDFNLLGLHTKLLGPGNTFCPLAPGAMAPLQSGIKYFRKEFEEHIGRKCPWS